MLRDKVIEGLKKIKVIKKGDYIDQNNPRLTVSYVN